MHKYCQDKCFRQSCHRVSDMIFKPQLPAKEIMDSVRSEKQENTVLRVSFRVSPSLTLCSSSQYYTWLPWKHTCSAWVVRPDSWDTSSGKQSCNLNWICWVCVFEFVTLCRCQPKVMGARKVAGPRVELSCASCDVLLHWHLSNRYGKSLFNRLDW